MYFAIPSNARLREYPSSWQDPVVYCSAVLHSYRVFQIQVSSGTRTSVQAFTLILARYSSGSVSTRQTMRSESRVRAINSCNDSMIQQKGCT